MKFQAKNSFESAKDSQNFPSPVLIGLFYQKTKKKRRKNGLFQKGGANICRGLNRLIRYRFRPVRQKNKRNEITKTMPKYRKNIGNTGKSTKNREEEPLFYRLIKADQCFIVVTHIE